MKILLLFIFVLVVAGAFVFKETLNFGADLPKTISPFFEIAKSSPSVSPFPFQEMTIPYLRAREYKSNLGNLEKVSETGSYTSYITNYDSDGLKINGLLTIPKEDLINSKDDVINSKDDVINSKDDVINSKDDVINSKAGFTSRSLGEGWPAIVFVHGYIPPSQYETLTRYVEYIDFLSRNGFVVFKIDLRGHGTSQGEAGGGYYSSDYIIDTLNAKAALQNADFVNPNKIGFWGHSMAGNVLLRSLAVQVDIPAIVIWAGAVYTYEDQQKYGISDNSYRPPVNASAQQSKRRQLFEKYGQFDPTSEFWKQVPATNYLQDIKGAIAINHAVDDPVVNIGYSRDLIKLLEETQIPHELYEYPSGGHNITGVSFTKAMQNTVSFFKKYL